MVMGPVPGGELARGDLHPLEPFEGLGAGIVGDVLGHAQGHAQLAAGRGHREALHVDELGALGQGPD